MYNIEHDVIAVFIYSVGMRSHGIWYNNYSMIMHRCALKDYRRRVTHSELRPCGGVWDINKVAIAGACLWM